MENVENCDNGTDKPSVRRLSRQREIINIPQTYRPPWPVTGIVLLTFYATLKDYMSVSAEFGILVKTTYVSRVY
jgi:hypothetical protein